VNNLAAASKDWRQTIATLDKRRRNEMVKNINVAIKENLDRPAPNYAFVFASVGCFALLGFAFTIGFSVYWVNSDEKNMKKFLASIGIGAIAVVALGFLFGFGLKKLLILPPENRLKNHLQFFKSVETSKNNDLESLLLEKDDAAKLINEKTPLLSG